MRTPNPPARDLLDLLRERVLVIVQQKGRDQNLRQLAVLLVCCSVAEPQTIRGLAQYLQTHKPAIPRAVDLLERAGLAKRQDDPEDRRSVLITATPAGRRYCARFFGSARTSVTQSARDGEGT